MQLYFCCKSWKVIPEIRFSGKRRRDKEGQDPYPDRQIYLGGNSLEFASLADKKELLDFYGAVIDKVNTTSVRLGWNLETYPNAGFIENAIINGEMCILRENGRIIAAGVVNHTVNPEYDAISWDVCEPKERIATIHALAVLPEMQGKKTGDRLLSDIESYCGEKGDLAIHLDVIDTNIPAYKLYTRNGYREKDCIRMYYEVVGTREFWMLERVL